MAVLGAQNSEKGLRKRKKQTKVTEELVRENFLFRISQLLLAIVTLPRHL